LAARERTGLSTTDTINRALQIYAYLEQVLDPLMHGQHGVIVLPRPLAPATTATELRSARPRCCLLLQPHIEVASLPLNCDPHGRAAALRARAGSAKLAVLLDPYGGLGAPGHRLAPV
jgi:hypothetical protein